jgi:membrane associated rhomboid family serine protease
MDKSLPRGIIAIGIGCTLMAIGCLILGYFSQAAMVATFGAAFGAIGGIVAWDYYERSLPQIDTEVQKELDKPK